MNQKQLQELKQAHNQLGERSRTVFTIEITHENTINFNLAGNHFDALGLAAFAQGHINRLMLGGNKEAVSSLPEDGVA